MTPIVKRVEEALPLEVRNLAVSAQREGFSHIAKLVTEWDSGFRYMRPGEILMTTWQHRSLAAVGGVTIDPVRSDGLRMRRFYVQPEYRRQGIGRFLARALMDHALSFDRPLFVHAGTAVAPVFWEALGFRKHDEDGHTHRFIHSE